MRLARLLSARGLLWLARTFPDLAETGRLLIRLARVKLGRKALRASRGFARAANCWDMPAVA